MDYVDEAIFEFAYRMALDDATGQQAYKGRGEGSKTKLRECDKAKQAVREYIAAVFDSNSRPDFEKSTAEVEKAFKAHLTDEDDGEFTFGNAQKLVNMTSKYMFMATYERPDLRTQFKSCHCPMDNVILSVVAAEAGKAVDSGNASDVLREFAEKCAKKRPRKLDWVVADDLKWSRLKRGDERYQFFQDVVRELASQNGVSPIEFDYVNWQ